MARIGFIGLGNMGLPMARNLLAAGHRVTAFDVARSAVEAAATAGASAARSLAEAVAGAEAVITMLPEGRQVREVYLGEGGAIAAAADGTLLVDCSTIDVASAQDVWRAAAARGLEMVDAPVSGGVTGATNATLTFMVGGEDGAVARAWPILEQLGATVVHTGPSGSGQAAKICNNMMLAISMIGVAEAFNLAARLGLGAEALFQVASRSSGQSWSLTTYCPVPGLVPSAPANRGYQAGFTAAMMAKDLRLAQDAANSVDAATPLGSEARNLYAMFKGRGHGDLDFSAIIRMIAGEL
ncbi:MAG TPA: 3-hydroxyisobutyrate dehydrogenase [Geminicoccaceae bacterium]|nr:3-hydroxyisobutyrate dehydrogenase [Geminicoccaceae bacterium]